MTSIATRKAARLFASRSVLAAAGLLVAFSAAGSATPTCFGAWSAGAVYTGGQTASYQNVNYTANWWTQGNNPSTNSGGAGSGQPWTSDGSCGSGTPPPPPPPPPAGSRFFSPYADMSLSADEQLLAMQQQAGLKAVTLAFVVGNSGGCAAGWGGLGQTLPADNMYDGQSIQSVVQSMQQSGVQVIISFGGANGQEPALTCTNVSQLQALYQSVLTRYDVNMLDFDIEGSAVADQASITRRDQALRGLKAANPKLAIAYTLPVLQTGLTNDGTNLLKSVKSDGLSLNTVNIMTMDYGSAVSNMGQAATQAATAVENQLAAAGLTSTTIGITPMIGQNDSQGEIFQLADAHTLLTFAENNKYVTSLGMWALPRDNGGCAAQTWASPTCSGVSQATYAFSGIFTQVQ